MADSGRWRGADLSDPEVRKRERSDAETLIGVGTGFLVGGVIGVGFGVLGAWLFAKNFQLCIFGPCEPPSARENAESTMGMVMFAGGVVGAPGAVVGATLLGVGSSRRKKITRAATPALVPTRGGAQLSWSLRF